MRGFFDGGPEGGGLDVTDDAVEGGHALAIGFR
jgi:hypothetical protein